MCRVLGFAASECDWCSPYWSCSDSRNRGILHTPF